MAGYDSRQSTVTDGNIGLASLWNDEYNAILNAFAASTGHAHDGTAGEGGYIPIIADADKHNYVTINGDTIEFWIDAGGAGTPVKQFTLSDGALTPTTDSDIDLGSAVKAFKDFYANTITVDSATINGNITVTGTVDGRDIATDGSKLDGISAGAEVNESSFKTINLTASGTGVVVGDSSIVADTDTDTLTIEAGDDTTITGSASGDKITVALSNGPTNAIVGPATATDNAIVRYDGATGQLAQDSGITIDDSDSVAGAGIDLASNTVTGTLAEFNTAISDDNVFGVSELTKAIGNINDTTCHLFRGGRLGDYSGTMAVTQAATVTYLDINGVYQDASANTLERGMYGFGPFLEETNSMLYSEDLSNWTTSGTPTLGTPLSAAGLTLDLVEDLSATGDTVYRDVTIPADTNTHVVRLHVKQYSTDDNTDIRIVSRASTINQTSDNFDIDFSTMSVTHITQTATCALSYYKEIAEGVLLVELTFTNIGTYDTLRVQVRPAMKRGAIIDTARVYFGGCMVSLNRTAVDEYIRTTTAAVTRPDTDVDLAGTNNIINPTKPWSVAFDATPKELFTNNGVACWKGVIDTHPRFSFHSGGEFRASYAGSFITTATVAGINEIMRYVVTYDGTTLSIYTNGVLDVSGAAVYSDEVKAAFHIGKQLGTTNHGATRVSNIRVWQSTLTAEEAALA